MNKFEAIESGIAEKDKEKLKEAMGNICYTDRSFSTNEFEEQLKHIKESGVDIIDDALDGELVSSGKAEFTDDDFANAVFELKYNFCRERIEDVKRIGRALYKPAPKPVASVRKEPTQTVGTSPNSESHRGTVNKAAVTAAAVAVIAAVVIIVLLIK
ncbi:hypothetical protein SAMN02910317_02874 [Ruminococcaceae bacterium FB2012]|nr:hypothetical protein SAMN02910317_02874 [Ruminococcaceae bacterium FB2012]